MSGLNMSEEEKKKILEQHKKATNDVNQKREELKKGLQNPKPKTKNLIVNDQVFLLGVSFENIKKDNQKHPEIE